jgi:biotin operon repressor
MALVMVEKKDVDKAIKEVKKKGVPAGRTARKYAIDGLPPKYIYCVAGKFATGEELSPTGFSATEAIKRLRKLGFDVVEKEA